MRVPGQKLSCSGGVLCWFVQDEQSKSRSASGGATVPNGLRGGLLLAAQKLKLDLDVDSITFQNVCKIPPRTPVPALSISFKILLHFAHLSKHEVHIVSVYAAGLTLATLACLRLRDAQRAALVITNRRVDGSTYSSKHPKRRSKVPMPFFAPRHHRLAHFAEPLTRPGGVGADYIFPKLRVPRGKDVLRPEAVVLEGPAKTADVIKVMRFILTLPPLSMSAADAKRFSGHSMRHLLPTLARLFGLDKEEREELARWAASPEVRGQRRAMPNVYSQEVAAPRVINIINKILQRAFATTDALGGFEHLPSFGHWDIFSSVPTHVPELPAEASSSESDSDGDTVVL